MKKVSIHTRWEDGFKKNKAALKTALDSFEGKDITLTIERKYKSRSLLQNAFYWGVLVPTFADLIREQWGEIKTAEEVHEILKFSCNFDEKVNEQTGEIVRIPQSTTILTTSGFMDYHQKLRQLALDFFNTVLPEPNEQTTFNL